METRYEVVTWRGEVYGTYSTREEAERNCREDDTVVKTVTRK